MAIRVDTPHRCPFCHDGVHATAAKIACDGCMAWHHRECWDAYGARCGACGAAQPAATRADPEPIRVDVRPRVRVAPNPPGQLESLMQAILEILEAVFRGLFGGGQPRPTAPYAPLPQDREPTAAPYAPLPGDPDYADAEVEQDPGADAEVEQDPGADADPAEQGLEAPDEDPLGTPEVLPPERRRLRG